MCTTCHTPTNLGPDNSIQVQLGSFPRESQCTAPAFQYICGRVLKSLAPGTLCSIFFTARHYFYPFREHPPMDDCDIFRDQLATTHPRYGHALWNPSPTRSDRPVEVGDVGFIRWGTFHRLFNALLPAGDPSHELGLPEGYKPLAPSLPNHINRRPFRCGHYCSNGICVGSVPDYQDGYLPSAFVIFVIMTH